MSIEEYASKFNKLSDNNEYTKIPLINTEWTVLKDRVEINTYLPQENNINITIGITKRKTYPIKNFDSIDISETIKNKRGHILNTGGSIWAIDFVPKRASLHNDDTHYVAVGGYNTAKEHYKIETTEKNTQYRNAIQLWKCTSSTNSKQKPILDMCFLHDFGRVIDFKWCPFSVYDEKDKIGILAALFSDGQVRLFVVPHPQLVRDQENIALEETVYVKVETPRLLLKLPRMFNLCLAWGGYNKLACGTQSRHIVVWNILESLLSQSPSINVTIPDASPISIRCISWLSLLDQHSLLISSDLDGNLNLHDLKDPFLTSRILKVNSTCVCLSGTGHGEGFLFTDLDGVSRKNVVLHGKKTITLTMHNSLIWSISASPLHGVIAAAASDGTVMVKPYSAVGYEINPKHKLNVPEFTLYKLVYNKDTQVLQYIDGLKPKTSLPERIYHNIFIDPIVSIQKVAWNNNKNGSGWVASGGKSGLCRLEFTGCG